MRPVPMDFEGYYQSIERCRRAFPDLRILTGVEFGQPISTAGLPPLTSTLSVLDRVNGSLHTLPFLGHRSEPPTLYRLWITPPR